MFGKGPLTLSVGPGANAQGHISRNAGQLGQLSVDLPRGGQAGVMDQELRFSAAAAVPARVYGLGFALVRNAVEGVSQGFSKELELVGVGYRAEKVALGLKLSLGFSHPVEFKIPEGVAVEVTDSTKIKLTGINKAMVTQTAAQLHKLRPPEPYKGKGIRYSGEVVRRKQGKVVKAAAGGAA